MVYSGPAAEAVVHFQENGFECPPYSNPSDYFMRVCTETEREREAGMHHPIGTDLACVPLRTQKDIQTVSQVHTYTHAER
jgi:hypothetical protein